MSNSILVVSPHPDDLEIGMGGTVAKLIEGGAKVISLIATDGSGSTTIKERSGEEMADMRLEEAREAVSILGIQTLIRLPLADVKTDSNKEHFKNDFKDAVLRFTPQEVYIPHPEIDKHPTHKLVAQLVVDELNAVSQDFKPDKVWCYEVWTPFSSYDRIEDISGYIDMKVMAIEVHESQLEYKNYIEGIVGLNRYRAVFDERHGVSEMQYAEVFIDYMLK